MMIAVPLDDLSPIDEHRLTVAAPPDVVWDATLESVGASFSAPWPRRLARLLGTDSALTSGWKRPAVGSTIPGFRIVAAHRPDLVVISGSHRFSRYGIAFRIEPSAGCSSGSTGRRARHGSGC